MSSDQYTPSDEDVREDFAYPWEGFRQDRGARLAAYDRWLAAHDARVRRDAAREALLDLDLRLEPLGRFQNADGIWEAQGEIADMLTNDYPEETP